MKRKKKQSNKFYGILLRYLILVAVAIPNLWIFYTIFTPLTVYPSYWLSDLFLGAFLTSKTTFVISGGFNISLISACIAGAAYYLLLILNLATPNIKVKKRLLMIGASFLTFLILNIIRVVLLAWIYISDNAIFDITHEIFWYALSTLFVVGIWFAEVKIFKVKDIPVYSDIKFLIKHSLKFK